MDNTSFFTHRMKSILFPFLITVFCFHGCLSQSFLVLETKGKTKTKKYPVGSIIRIHFKNEPRYLWDNYTILGLDLKNKCIQVSEVYCIALKDIDGFDTTPGKGNGIQRLTGKFFLQWTFFSVIQAIFKPPLTAFHFIVAGAAAAVWVFSKFFLNGEKKINGRHRLRLIDLTIDRPRA